MSESAARRARPSTDSPCGNSKSCLAPEEGRSMFRMAQTICPLSPRTTALLQKYIRTLQVIIRFTTKGVVAINCKNPVERKRVVRDFSYSLLYQKAQMLPAVGSSQHNCNDAKQTRLPKISRSHRPMSYRFSFWRRVSSGSWAKAPVDYIDPFIGTGHPGQTFPGAVATPGGMVQLSAPIRLYRQRQRIGLSAL